jgi:RNA polymerase sigma-70 factor, ECF subfamily
MNVSDDRELVEQFQNGNESSFNELVRRYQEKIYWIARRIVANHDGADDVTQEVFIKAYAALKDFRGDSSFYTWLYRITVNLSLNAIRKQKVKEFFRYDDFFDVAAEADELPDRMIELDEQRQLIDQAVQMLPEKQKAVFVLRHYEELSYEEISNIMKTSIGGLKANYFHAIKKIGEYVARANKTY